MLLDWKAPLGTLKVAIVVPLSGGWDHFLEAFFYALTSTVRPGCSGPLPAVMGSTLICTWVAEPLGSLGT